MVNTTQPNRERTKIAYICLRLPPTTKKDRTRHGYGLRSIRMSVEKYGGHMEIRQEEGQFTLFGYLPMHSATPQRKNN